MRPFFLPFSFSDKGFDARNGWGVDIATGDGQDLDKLPPGELALPLYAFRVVPLEEKNPVPFLLRSQPNPLSSLPAATRLALVPFSAA